ncbi:hypothetical protein ACFL5O_09990 [Myxococcota bacterium]
MGQVGSQFSDPGCIMEEAAYDARAMSGLNQVTSVVLSVLLACSAGSTFTGCKCSDDDRPAAVKQEQKRASKRRKRSRRPAEKTHEVTVGSQRRRYVVVPPSSTEKKRPVILFFHGENDTVNRFQDKANVYGGARKFGYLLAIPAAQQERRGQRGRWMHGVCAGEPPFSPVAAAASAAAGPLASAVPAIASKTSPVKLTLKPGSGVAPATSASAGLAAEGTDDVAFVRAMLEDLKKNYQVDAGRVYALGFSTGAAMVHRLASEMSGELAAIGVVGGAGGLPEPAQGKLAATHVPHLGRDRTRGEGRRIPL